MAPHYMIGVWLVYVQDADYLLEICWQYAYTHEAALLSDAMVDTIWYCSMIASSNAPL